MIESNWMDPTARRNAAAILRMYCGGQHRGVVELVDSLTPEERAQALIAVAHLASGFLRGWLLTAGTARRAAERGIDVSEVEQNYLQDVLLAAAAEEAG